MSADCKDKGVLLQRIAHCNAEKSAELISCGEAVLETLKNCSVGRPAALERLFYLVMSLEGMEHKIRRGIIPPRDPIKLDLEAIVNNCFDTITDRLKKDCNPSASKDILIWCFKSLYQVKENFKLTTSLESIMLICTNSMFVFDKSTFVNNIFEMFLKECPKNSNISILSKVFSPHPSLLPEIVTRCHKSYLDKGSNFGVHKALLADLSHFNSNSVCTAVMLLLEKGDEHDTIGFVLNVLRSIPALQSIAITLLYESNAFKKLINNSDTSIPLTMIDDLAKLFMLSQANSYSTVMSLLQKDGAGQTGTILLERVLLNIELAVYGIQDNNEKSIPFLDNLSSEADTRMLSLGLSQRPAHTHTFILKILSLICVYKGYTVTKSIIRNLFVTQPLPKYQALLNSLHGVYPVICKDCFEDVLKNVYTNTSRLSQAEIHTFFTNIKELGQVYTKHSAEHIVAVSMILKDTSNYQLVAMLLPYLDPSPVQITDAVFITNIIANAFLNFCSLVKADCKDFQLLEIIEDIKLLLLKWCSTDCVSISVLNNILTSVTDSKSESKESGENESEHILAGIKHTSQAVVDVHRGSIKRTKRATVSSTMHGLMKQQVMSVIQSISEGSAKARNELCVFLLQFLCQDVNLNASWPDEESMKYTVERDLNAVKKFERSELRIHSFLVHTVHFNLIRYLMLVWFVDPKTSNNLRYPILWELFEGALVQTKHCDLSVIVRAFLIVQISYWSSSRVGCCAEAVKQCQDCVKLFEVGQTMSGLCQAV